MGVTAVVTLPLDALPLGEVLRSDRCSRVDFESLVPAHEQPLPYAWVTGDPGAVDEVAAGLSALSVERVESGEGRTLFALDWRETTCFLESLAAVNATVTSLSGDEHRWTLKARFRTHEDLSAFYDRCRSADCEVHLERVVDSASAVDSPYGLTREQRDAVLAAMDAGYFAVPRETTLLELSEQLGISDSAVSQRIRRGLQRLVSASLLDDAVDRENR